MQKALVFVIEGYVAASIYGRLNKRFAPGRSNIEFAMFEALRGRVVASV